MMVSSCATSVTGRAVRASGEPGIPAPAHAAAMARDLLLQDGDTTPLGAATATAVDDSYFTGARPPECSAALLFKGSPLLSPGSSDRAESAYRVGGPALYAESVDVYDEALKASTRGWSRRRRSHSSLNQGVKVSGAHAISARSACGVT